MDEKQKIDALIAFAGTAAYQVFILKINEIIEEYTKRLLNEDEDFIEVDNEVKYTEKEVLSEVRKKLMEVRDYPDKLLTMREMEINHAKQYESLST